MTLKELRDNTLRLLWLENSATVPSYIWEDVTTAINSALQVLWQTPKDYFRKQEVTIVIADGSEETSFDNDVQEVIGPIWIPAESDRELHLIKDQSEWNQFYQRFFGVGSESAALAAGVERVSYYHIKQRFQNDADPAKVSLQVKPKPSGSDTSLTVVVAKEAASYTVGEITGLSGTELVSIPHAYVESILLPIARWMATRSHYFFEKDKLGLIQQDADRAMKLLDISDTSMGTGSKMAETLKEQAST